MADGPPIGDGAPCFIEADGDDSTPTEVIDIVISEINFDLNEVDSILSGNFNDGYRFTYTSNSVKLNPDVPLENQEQEVPIAIQINLLGVNAAGQSVTNTVGVYYNLTICDAEPISEGDKIGWIEVEAITPAFPEFCPAVQTDPPTPSPVSGSMSYSASFSLAHMSKASKGKATKSVSKSGKLIRERN